MFTRAKLKAMTPEERQLYFEEVWNTHNDWAQGVLFSSIENEGETATIFRSDIPSEYFNFAVPRVTDPERFDLAAASGALKKRGNAAAVTLFEEHQREGFKEYLVREGMRLESRDVWLVLNPQETPRNTARIEVARIGGDRLDDFSVVLREVFRHFTGNEQYLEMEKMFLSGKIKSNCPDLALELFVVYENDEPAAAAGLFLSESKDFAYLHDAGTREKYRRRGYQTALVNHRVNRARELGLRRAYTVAEHGGTSWANVIRAGFGGVQRLHTMVEKKDSIEGREQES